MRILTKEQKEHLDKLTIIAGGDFELVLEALRKAKEANIEKNIIYILTYIIMNKTGGYAVKGEEHDK